MITTILFDLDGTLLPMDQEVFVKEYLRQMAAKMSAHGYEPKKLIDTIWQGTAAMVRNDGSQTNEAILWDHFAREFGESSRNDISLFEDFYQNEFQFVQNVCGFHSDAANVIQEIKSMGFRVALATNPLFPALATYSRTRWAGLAPVDFDLITTYENSRYCKPNPAYYQDVINTLGIKAGECIMVGNDSVEDVAAEKLGIPVFLLTDCLINKNNLDISCYPHGGFPELLDYIKGLNK